MVVIVDPTLLSAHLGLLVGTVARVGSAVAQLMTCLSSASDRADREVSQHRAQVSAATQLRQRAEGDVARAQEKLDTAIKAASLASAALQAARARTTTDAEGRVRPADTSAEQAALNRAEEHVRVARGELARLAEALARALAALARAEQELDSSARLQGRVRLQVDRAGEVVRWASLFAELAGDASFLLTIRLDLLDQYLGDLAVRVTQAHLADSAGAATVAAGFAGAVGVLASSGGAFSDGLGDVAAIAGVAQGLTDLGGLFGGGLAALVEGWPDEAGRRYRDAYAEPLRGHLGGIGRIAEEIGAAMAGIQHDHERGNQPDSWGNS